MYEDLIKRLRYENLSVFQMIDLMDEAADTIEEEDMAFRHLERDYKALCAYLPKWIPVAERLPEPDVPVLVYLFRDSPYIAWIDEDGEWETEEFIVDKEYQPEFWFPLPMPQKE